MDVDSVYKISLKLEENLEMFGFEFHPFKIDWYNTLVKDVFHLDYNEDTLAFLVISTPRMFEDGFMPFVHQMATSLASSKDLIDESMMFYMEKIRHIFPAMNIDLMHDFELHPNRRPKVVFQSAAHASGAAYFYHHKDLEESCEIHCKTKKMYGVCIHPKYGGWFALRAVAIFRDVVCPTLPKKLPPDVVPRQEDRKLLLEFYNNNWKDWKFRDIVPVAERYSDLQIKYFSTAPGERLKVIEEILQDTIPKSY